MAGSSGFFDATELADGTYDKTYVAEQFAKYFSLFVGNGVFANPANQLKVVSANNGMYVTVLPGCAFINGYWFNLDAGYTFPITINDSSTNDRIDGVFVRLDLSEGEIDIVYEAGRSTPNRTAPYYELKLCDIAVPIASTQITDAQITDRRGYESVCGFVANLIEITHSESLFTQWAQAFQELYDSFDTGSEEWIEGQKTAFASWFQQMKDQLTTDAAGNLQTQIDEMNGEVATRFRQIEPRFFDFYAKNTTFNPDGSITEEGTDGVTKVTVFNSDGSITETLKKNDVTLMTKTTTFNADDSITETISGNWR